MVDLEQPLPAAIPAERRTLPPDQSPWHRYYPEAGVVVAITLLAAVLRLWHLGSLPPGLHGDEAWTGIDAHRILSEGWIGAYVPSALGQPTGPLYWTAFVFKLLGEGILQLRFSMAILGILTVPATYVAARVMFEDRRIAAVSALMLALMTWHLVFSRAAFLVISWPLMEMAVVSLLFLALKRDELRWYALAGLALGLGLYTYNVYPLFAVAAGIFLVAQLIQRSFQRDRIALGLAIVVGCTLLTAAPLVHYVIQHGDTYKNPFRIYTLPSQPAFKNKSAAGKVRELATRAKDYAKLLVWGDHADLTDGTGRKASLDWLTLALSAGGLYIVLRRPREPSTQLLLIMLIILPFGAIGSLDAGMRRTLGLAPFICMLAAQPLARLWPPEGMTAHRVWVGAMAAVLVLFALFNVGSYFPDYNDNFAKFVFAQQDASAALYMQSYPGHPYVYFFSPRWRLSYETTRYLAPDIKGEDRSTQFGPPQLNLVFDRNRDSLVILMAPYLDLGDRLKSLYADATVHTEGGGDDADPLFIALFLPRNGR